MQHTTLKLSKENQGSVERRSFTAKQVGRIQLSIQLFITMFLQRKKLMPKGKQLITMNLKLGQEKTLKSRIRNRMTCQIFAAAAALR